MPSRKRAELEKLKEKMGGVSGSHSSNDLSLHLGKDMMVGDDGREYVDRPVRRAIEKQIKSSLKKYATLQDAPMPEVAFTLMKKAQAADDNTAYLSSRSKADGYRSGFDCAYTENLGSSSGKEKRQGSDTPRPRSPSPVRDDDALENTRYEYSHSDPYRFTRLPGHTVHAPTQFNQAADSYHERFAAKRPGGFVVQYHTWDATTTFSGRPTNDGQVEVQHSSYLRRKASSGSDQGSSSSSAAASSSSSSSPVQEPPKKKTKR